MKPNAGAGHAGCVASFLVCAACSGSSATSRPPPLVFGGEGATVGPPKEQPLAAAPSAQEHVPAGPCAQAAPASDVALVDDFEDGDVAAFHAFQREGYWFAAADSTEGATLLPEKGAFKPERLAAGEGSRANLFAAHFKASGERDWGAVWGVTLRWRNEGIRCPLNASAYAGLRFRAKGPGTVRVAIGVPATQPAESGGTCTSRCYDVHAKVLVLTDRWDDYLVRWTQLEQQGWGAEAKFDPSRVTGFQLMAGPKELPVDFWIDDVSFVTEPEAVALDAALRAQPPPAQPSPAGPATARPKAPSSAPPSGPSPKAS